MEPSSQLSSQDRDDYIRIAQLLEHKDSEGRLAEKPKAKRLYEMWSPADKFLLIVGVAIYGPQGYKKIATMFKNRSPGQVFWTY